MQPQPRDSVIELPETPEDKVEDEKKEAAASNKIVNRPKRTHRRSYSDISQVFKSPTRVIHSIAL